MSKLIVLMVNEGRVIDSDVVVDGEYVKNSINNAIVFMLRLAPIETVPTFLVCKEDERFKINAKRKIELDIVVEE